MTGLQNSRNPARADFDWRRFAYAVVLKCRAEGRGLRTLAEEIGVTASDLSRAMGGQAVSVGKVIAMAQWADCDVMDFYQPPITKPMKTDCCSGPNVEHRAYVNLHEAARDGR
jgi:hypothetical protein